MTNIAALERKVAALEARVERMVALLAEYSPVSRTSAAGDKDYVSFSGEPSDQHRLARRMSPWGLSGRYVTGVLAGAVKAVGGAFNAMVFGIATDKYGPGTGSLPALDEGETMLYCSEDGTKVYLDKDGKVHVDSASGEDVVVNGGAAKVSRVGDHSNGGTLEILGGVSTSFSGLQYTDPDGVVTTVMASGVPLPLKAKLTEGADHFKG